MRLEKKLSEKKRDISQSRMVTDCSFCAQTLSNAMSNRLLEKTKHQQQQKTVQLGCQHCAASEVISFGDIKGFINKTDYYYCYSDVTKISWFLHLGFFPARNTRTENGGQIFL